MELDCPVCGAPHTTCGPGNYPGHITFTEWASDAPKPAAMEDRPVLVRERVTETMPAPSDREITVVRYNPGDFISVDEARRLGVPLLDENGAAVVDQQKPKPKVETQQVHPPRRKKRKPKRK